MGCRGDTAVGAVSAVGARSGAVTVNTPPLRTDAAGVVTVSGPVAAPTGTVATSRVAVLEVATAGTSLNVTLLSPAPAPKPVPEMVTAAPMPPVAGVKLVMAGPPGAAR